MTDAPIDALSSSERSADDAAFEAPVGWAGHSSRGRHGARTGTLQRPSIGLTCKGRVPGSWVDALPGGAGATRRPAAGTGA